MTTKRMSEPDFGQLLTAWFEADAPTREPVGLLDRSLDRSRRARRRPAWLLPEWWIPMQLAMRWRAVPRFAPILVVLALLVALATAILLVGSRQRLPDPFGPAANGQVVFLSEGQIYAANPDGSHRVQLTFGDRAASTPSWSRDGTRFAYKLIGTRSDLPDPTLFGDLIVVNADGSNPITIDHDSRGLSPPTWSADGRWLTYSRFAGAIEQIFVAPSDGSSPPVRVGNPDTINWAPLFSPDGTKIAYFVDVPDSTAPLGRLTSVEVMNLDGSARRPLNTIPFTAMDSGVWHPDGNRFVVSAAIGNQEFDLWFLSPDGPEQQIRVPDRAEVGPSWSPDGSRLAFLTTTNGRTYFLTVAGASGTGERSLDGVYSQINPTWSPDGRLIAVVNESTERLTLVDPDGLAEPIHVDSFAPAETVVADRSSPTSWQRIAP